MATKINIRSPFYLTVDEPVVGTPTFSCSTPEISGLSISKEGVISQPQLSFGIFDSFQVTGQSYSNNKFPTVSTSTPRTFDVRVLIPIGFTNTNDAYIDCPFTINQPAQDTGSGEACENGVAASGSVSSQSLTTGGNSTTIDFASKFTGSPTSYVVTNLDPGLVNTSFSGTTLTIGSNERAGSITLIVQATDANGCQATQSVSVTVSFPVSNPRTLVCNDVPLQGGSIAQDGTITKPTTFVAVGSIRDSENGNVITSHSANGTGSDRPVTLYFDIPVPTGYSNVNSTLSCPKTFNQPTSLPLFDCDTARLTGQSISSDGDVRVGVSNGGLYTIESYSPLQFDPIDADANQSVTFNITIPSTFSNHASSPFACVVPLKQPGQLPTAGANNYFLTSGFLQAKDMCDRVYYAATGVTSDSPRELTGLGHRVFRNGVVFDGGNRFYGVKKDNRVNMGYNTGAMRIWQINSSGVVTEVLVLKCRSEGEGAGEDRDVLFV